MIKEIFQGIGKVLLSIQNSITESMYSLRVQKKTSSKFDLSVDVITENKNIETYAGTLTPNKEFAYIPKLQRPIFKPIIFQKEGKNKIIISEKQHDNMSYAYIKNLDMGLKNTLEIKSKITPKGARAILNFTIKDKAVIDEVLKSWDYDDLFATIEVKDIGGSLNLSEFSNEYSIPFASQSELIINSELLKFLLKPTDMTILTTAIIGFLAGMVITFLLKAGGG
jgi:hypothetical protein